MFRILKANLFAFAPLLSKAIQKKKNWMKRKLSIKKVVSKQKKNNIFSGLTASSLLFVSLLVS
jgi:hypothetical protein